MNFVVDDPNCWDTLLKKGWSEVRPLSERIISCKRRGRCMCVCVYVYVYVHVCVCEWMTVLRDGKSVM